jgi:Ca-activated chloride channel family protein
MRATTWLVCLAAVCACAVGCAGAQVVDEGEDPELVVLEGELGNAFVLGGAESDVISRIRVQTRPLENAARPPINLALVVDTSGSMMGDPISDARAASLALLDMLGPDDRLAVIAFHSETEVLLPSTRLRGADMAELRAQIGRMQAQGTTDLGGGMRVGLEELVRNFEPEGINRLVLLSDGVPNDPNGIVALSQAAGERGIRVTALGLGLDYDETLLAQIAQSSGGRFHSVEDSSAVATTFRDEVLRFERVIARNLFLELRPGPGVRIDGVVGQPVAVGGGVVRVPLGDLSEGERRDIIVRAHAAARRPGATVELMDAVLTFEDAVVNAGGLERRVFLGARAMQTEEEVAAGRNEDVERAAARMTAALTTVQAIQVARAGDVEEARRILERARMEAERVAVRDDRLREQVSEMRVLEGALPAMAEPSVRAGGTSYSFDDESVEGEMAAPPAAVIRRTHGAAMEVLQSTDPP